MKESVTNFIEKKGIMLVEMSNSEDSLMFLHEILTHIQDKSASTYDIIFSLYMKENCENIKFGLIYN